MRTTPAQREKVLGIIAEVALGEPVYKLCKEYEIGSKGFYRALAEDEGLQQAYAAAKDAALDIIAEEIIQLADECRPGTKVKTSKRNGEEVTTGDMVERSRLQIDARKWLLAHLAPKKYGDRTIIAGDADNPLSVDVADAKAALLSRLGAGAAAGTAAGLGGDAKR